MLAFDCRLRFFHLGSYAQDKPINFVIQTSSSYDELQKMVDAMLEKVRGYPGLVDVDSDLKLIRRSSTSRSTARRQRR